MSLLNDALKRAQEAQRPNTPSGGTTFHSVETRRRRRSVFSRPLVVAIFLLLIAGIGFIGPAMTGRLAKKVAAAPPVSQARTVPVVAAPAPVAAAAPAVVNVAPVAPVPAPVTAPITAPKPVPAAAPAPAPAIAATPTPEVAPAPPISPAPAPAIAPAPAPVVAVAAPAPPPPLVLPDTIHVQGIAHGSAHPWAIVSGRTVYVGDSVKGFQVMAIGRDSVTFGDKGQTSVLFVGQ